MAKHWLAVIRGNDFIVARVAVRKNKEMKIHFLVKYPGKIPMTIDTDEAGRQELKELKKWLQELNIPLRKLKIAISSLGLITRVVDLPQMSHYDLENLMTNHIDQYFTIQVSNYLIDYRVLNKYWENDKQMFNVLLGAFPMERMEYVLELCKLLGFEPSVVDLTADCDSRIYGHLSRKNILNEAVVGGEGSSTGDMAIISLHEDKVEFVLLRAGQFFLYSDMEIDIRTLIEKYEERIVHPKEGLATYSVDKENTDKISTYLNDEDETKELSAYLGGETQVESKNDNHDVMEKKSEAEGIIDLSSYDEEKIELYGLMDEDVDYELESGLIDSQEVFLETPDLEIDYDNENTIEIRNNDIDFGINELDELIGLEDISDFTASLPQLHEEDFRQEALNIDHQEDLDDSEEEFLLEDLFVPLDKLNNDLAKIKAEHSVDDLEELESDNKEENIFDTLDLDKTLIGIEEFEYQGSGIDSKEELENNFSPVLNNLSELLGFFAARNFGHSVNAIYLTGEYSEYPYLAKILQENLGIITVAGLPNGWQPQIAKRAKGEPQDWQKYACLFGLALRED